MFGSFSVEEPHRTERHRPTVPTRATPLAALVSGVVAKQKHARFFRVSINGVSSTAERLSVLSHLAPYDKKLYIDFGQIYRCSGCRKCRSYDAFDWVFSTRADQSLGIMPAPCLFAKFHSTDARLKAEGRNNFPLPGQVVTRRLSSL